jgi:hypothetical protein
MYRYSRIYSQICIAILGRVILPWIIWFGSICGRTTYQGDRNPQGIGRIYYKGMGTVIKRFYFVGNAKLCNCVADSFILSK